MIEMLGVFFRLTNPRARISRSQDRGKPFSALGELLWYLKGTDRLDFIEPYIPPYAKDAENGALRGAYGPRLFSMRNEIDQLGNVIKLLETNSTSKRAVIQLFDASDIEKHYKEIPCTSTMQFFNRNGHLHLSVTMRSNDAYKGLPHDVFCFTMLQEMLARRLGCEVGEYLHYVGSMHVYDDCLQPMRDYIEEGWQKTVVMPPMSKGNPFDLVEKLLDIEVKVRAGQHVAADETFDDPYWADIVRLLQVFWATRADSSIPQETVEALGKQFASDVFPTFLDRRIKIRERAAAKDMHPEKK
nr:thymidylate synthase [Rhizobium leguminosarum]